MRLAVAGLLAFALLVGMRPAVAEGRLAPSEIQSTFFNGQPFTAATPSDIKFKMTFSADGKVTRQPLGKGGAKGAGTWKLSKDGFCTAWQGGQPNCFVVQPGAPNKWSVLKGAMVVATWSK
jgi:hypothetical protein